MTYSIGALAQEADCPVETIRFYERAGLLPKPARTRGGHRVYEEAHRRVLGIVRRARGLGFPLEQVRTLLQLADDPDVSSCEARALAVTQLVSVRAKLADLARMEATLSVLVDRCRAEKPGCPILQSLDADGPPTPAPVKRKVAVLD